MDFSLLFTLLEVVIFLGICGLGSAFLGILITKESFLEEPVDWLLKKTSDDSYDVNTWGLEKADGTFEEIRSPKGWRYPHGYFVLSGGRRLADTYTTPSDFWENRDHPEAFPLSNWAWSFIRGKVAELFGCHKCMGSQLGLWSSLFGTLFVLNVPVMVGVVLPFAGAGAAYAIVRRI